MARRKQDKLHVEPNSANPTQDSTVDNKLRVEPIPAKPLQGDNVDKKIPFDEMIEKGRNLISSVEKSQFELGLLADKVEPKYGDQTLKHAAEELKIDYGTLKSYRTFYKKWKDAPVRPPFSVAKALNQHPNRADIIQENPDITVTEAVEKMREWKQSRADEKGKMDQSDDVIEKNKKQIVRTILDFLSDRSVLRRMILEINSQPDIDSSYMEEIREALGIMCERVFTLIEDVAGPVPGNVEEAALVETAQAPAEEGTAPVEAAPVEEAALVETAQAPAEEGTAPVEEEQPPAEVKRSQQKPRKKKSVP
jgi:hypothetical protein